MPHRLALGALTAAVAFLAVTNPVVSEAAGQITGKQIKNSSVTGKDVKNGSLKAADFKAGQLPAGPVGAAGAPGAPGADGVLKTGWANFDRTRDNGGVSRALPADESLGDVLKLSGLGPGSGSITLGTNARLVVSASAYLANQDTSVRSFGCELDLRPSVGPASVITFLTYDVLGSNTPMTWSQTGSVGVGPGTYDVALRCGTGTSNSGGRVSEATLTVLALRA